jgi:hypothetical protein
MSASEPSFDEKETLEDRGSHEAEVLANVAPLNTAHVDKNAEAEKARADVDLEKKGADTVVARTETQDPNAVWWDGPDDPANPMNWSNFLKVVNVGLVSGICFVTPLASCE